MQDNKAHDCSAHINNIHPNAIFILLLNSIYSNIAIAQEHEHVHTQAGI